MGGMGAALSGAASAVGSGVKNFAADTGSAAMHSLFGKQLTPQVDPGMSHTAGGAPSMTQGVVGAAPSTVNSPVTAGLTAPPSSPFRTGAGQALFGTDADGGKTTTQSLLFGDQPQQETPAQRNRRMQAQQ